MPSHSTHTAILARATNYSAPDALIAAASYINYDYGLTGYSISPALTAVRGVSLFAVRHTDGSEFLIAADYFGRACRIPDDYSLQGWSYERFENLWRDENGYASCERCGHGFKARPCSLPRPYDYLFWD